MIKDGTGVVVKEAVVSSAKGFLGTVGGFATSMGISLAVQGALSVGSAVLNSGWKE